MKRFGKRFVKTLGVAALAATILFAAIMAVSPSARAQTVQSVEIFYRAVAFRGPALFLGNQLQLDVDGDTILAAATDDAVTLTATTTTIGGGDLTLSPDTTGGDLAAKNEVSGRLRLSMVSLGTMTNGSTATVSLMDDTPAGEWSASNTPSGAVTRANSTTHVRYGTNSLKVDWAATAGTTDGITVTVASADWSNNESVGCWVYCSETLSAGDLKVGIKDTGAGWTLVNLPAVSTASKWLWLEADISGVANASKDSVDNLDFELSAAGATAHGAFTCYFDWVYKWDATNEEALGAAVLQDGVLAVLAVTTANTGTHTQTALVEGTDYLVHYETGNDFLITVTDQSANSALALYNY